VNPDTDTLLRRYVRIVLFIAGVLGGVACLFNVTIPLQEAMLSIGAVVVASPA
jgi:hypothetical protein